MNIDSPQILRLDGMFKTRSGGNAFFYFVMSAAEVLVSFGKLFIAAATLAAYYQRSSSSIMDLRRSLGMREKPVPWWATNGQEKRK